MWYVLTNDLGRIMHIHTRAHRGADIKYSITLSSGPYIKIYSELKAIIIQKGWCSIQLRALTLFKNMPTYFSLVVSFLLVERHNV